MKQYLRAYEPVAKAEAYPRRKQPLPKRVLVFDTETTIDTEQNLRVGAYQLRINGKLVRKGYFYPGSTLYNFVRLLARVGAKPDAAIVGFNLPFDISRVAYTYGPARGRFSGGFSFLLWKNGRIRIRTKRLGTHKTLFGWTNGEGRSRGCFVDIQQLSNALLGRSHSLKSLAMTMGTEHQKLEAEHGKKLDKKYLEYLAADVQVTWECYEKLAKLWKSYKLEYVHISKVYSEASVGKAALKQIGITPFMAGNSDVTDYAMAAAMESFYGGRSEVHIRRKVERIVYADFLSMYPTVCTLMGLWKFVTAKELEVVPDKEGITRVVQEEDLSRLYRKEDWQRITGLVRIKPAGDLLPVRANYQGSEATIGLNYLSTNEAVWYTLADVLVSKLFTGKVPEIVEAFWVRPKGRQEKLQPLDIMGMEEYRIDPYREDFYKRLIELRATTSGDERTALKLVANSTCYGIFAELNENAERVGKRRYLTGNGYVKGKEKRRAEEPGVYFCPFLATFITGAARLMLATLEKSVTNAKLTWLLCDTDSFAISIRNADDVSTVHRIVSKYSSLNPYEENVGNILKIEHGEDSEQAVYGYAISAKRYAFCSYNGSKSPSRTSGLRPKIVKASAHALGHLLPPDAKKEKEAETPLWLIPIWQELIYMDGVRKEEPQFRGAKLDYPAMSQFTVTGSELLRYGLKPYTFVSILYLGPAFPYETDSQVAIAPFTTDPMEAACTGRVWCKDVGLSIIPWFRYNLELEDCVKTYRSILERYRFHAEAKFNPNENARGVLHRQHVKPDGVVYIGKEGGDVEAKEHEVVEQAKPYVEDKEAAKEKAERSYIIEGGRCKRC